VQDIIPVFKKRPEYDLLIAGDGDYSERLKKQAGGSSNIKFLGRLEQDRLKRLYEKATAVIVPSVCYETFGIIIIEAFSNKTPVIVNNLGALPEAIEDSGGGFVYNNRGELVKALKMLAGNSALRSELGNRGFEAFLKFWNEEAHLTKYFNLIEKIQKSPETVVTKRISERLLETF
jgi:glycosyltransferase involved in cell wall biosynthesis